MRLTLLIGFVLAFAVSAAWAAGCPSGTKRHCVQGKSGIQCYCR